MAFLPESNEVFCVLELEEEVLCNSRYVKVNVLTRRS